MAAKTDAKEAPAAPEKSGTAPAESPKPASGGALKTWLPVLLAVVVAPAACWAVAEFVLLPRLQQKLTAVVALGPEAAAHALPAEAHGEAKKSGHGGGKEEAGGAGDTYEFTNVVVNLSGTMGTRYLKTSFVVTGTKPGTVKEAFESNKARLTDVTLGVLSSLSLADLEEPGAKNVLREKLITAYNQALGGAVADQVYFSDFVIQ
ncbi:flagellar basal body-associated protein FliL [Lacunisphaera limnophila]|uniref:Flagellar protein FliL n=1 Tax=Lacunisphaera limnophila TaxID=1838286 RepID=A0A1D8AW49_9BACT|nr:flagellar basal body-associated FliL family protein [Lacunisphaera limnophila]AOS45117.1 flagellar basal body-associated protein FliL [Lacunisphaera limnophila]